MDFEQRLKAVMEEVGGILGERRSADVRAADDIGVGTASLDAPVTAPELGYPFEPGKLVKVSVPTTGESMSAEVVKAESVKAGHVRVRISESAHPLSGQEMDWPASLVKESDDGDDEEDGEVDVEVGEAVVTLRGKKRQVESFLGALKKGGVGFAFPAKG